MLGYNNSPRAWPRLVQSIKRAKTLSSESQQLALKQYSRNYLKQSLSTHDIILHNRQSLYPYIWPHVPTYPLHTTQKMFFLLSDI